MASYYFDGANYWRMVRLVAKEQNAARRRSMRFALLVVVPLASLVHAVCFALDPLVFPRLRRTEVRAPVFMVGHARSGTTYLHRLLAADPQFSYVLLWEMFFPSLLEKKALRAVLRVDARLGGRIRRRILAAEERQVGEFRGMHDTGLFSPEEDDFLLATSCGSGFWIALFPYMRQFDFYHVDRWPARKRKRVMSFYRECVRRQLALNSGAVTHLSKNPTFCGRIDALLETFPDARFIVQVRNPHQTIPSLLRLLQVGWESRGADPERVKDSLRLLAEQSFHSYEYPLEVLESHPDVPSLVVEYRDLVGDPQATLAKVYDELRIPPPAASPAAVGGPGGEHRSTHRYSLEEFGLEAEAIHRRLAPLFDRFGWDPTPPSAQPDDPHHHDDQENHRVR